MILLLEVSLLLYYLLPRLTDERGWITLQRQAVMFQLDMLIIASEACQILRAHRS